MKGFTYLFIAAIVAFPQLLSAQIDYTITNDSVGNDHTLLRSNVSKIESNNDYLEVEAGWNWLSFPRMERCMDGEFDTEVELSYLSVFPDRQLKMHYQYSTLLFNYKEFTPPFSWSGFLDDVKSTSGYKLNIGGNDVPMYIHLKGEKLGSETIIDLYASAPENWVGYFVEYPQLPQDCFSPATWDASYIFSCYPILVHL